MSEYQYATAILEPDGTVWDYYPRHDGYRGGFDEAEHNARRWNAENADSDQACVVVRRTPPTKAGEWEVIANPSASAVLVPAKDET